jgi:hypothetical protein
VNANEHLSNTLVKINTRIHAANLIDRKLKDAALAFFGRRLLTRRAQRSL